jgi:hypothetical protein
MRRLTTFLTLLMLVLLVVAAPAGAHPKQIETYSLDGWGFPIVAVDGIGIRTVLEGSGTFDTLGETAIVQTQRIVGWNGEDPFELLGKTVRGEIRLTAENGDELFGTYVGEIVFMDVPPGWDLPRFAYLGALTFRNGTGRFHQAKGTVQIESGQCLNWEMGYLEILGGTIEARG